ncbi:AbrB/MazE/SpoVT family DNA-binding domain-containing protein [Candidatus Woesearchaeota archaeon]|nr:AbrB/MazE/SpoVT family DNA-binding domain-containing protein [Candidatus Woesearchaeota archaeon]
MQYLTVMARTRRVGGSLMVTIPKDVVDLAGVHPDDYVELHLRKVKKSYRGILKCIGSLRKEEKLDVHEDYS